MLDKILQPITSSFSEMYNDVAGLLPKLVAGLVIFLVGFFIAKLLRSFVGTLLKRLKFDAFLERMGASSVLQKIGLKSSTSELLANGLFWLVMLFIVKNAAREIGIADIELLITAVIGFLPKVLVSCVIMLVGFIVAELIQNASRNCLEALNLSYAKSLSNILFGFVAVLVLTVALNQLGIETELLNSSVKIILASLGLAMSIALGLGLKGLAGAVVSGVYARDVYKPGTEVEIDGELARVSGVGPVTTKLQTKDGGFVMVPNGQLIEHKVKGQSAE